MDDDGVEHSFSSIFKIDHGVCAVSEYEFTHASAAPLQRAALLKRVTPDPYR